ncbi:glycerol-3-phosphate 1-O-acyltransferase PlsB [Wenzhouxiangella sp. AB-CW3]|uniref:glycerol-3-phosphate 1-O-acyltransferase PlsB n=1 Tax=Wenzhouxiangella sp. AB-CW3 TaxID=2771012 RepID=UPI00168B5B1A|nr:glycerol-3-phosphate 1-O-acyltransferase PlsB [Wenzhouxiangella sp. AB-CW3]QOC22688.1 glycerol-3-phosphate 1-O-acyltransferase PlsB [Wenzhouxiangella sp. AB-CW3]
MADPHPFKRFLTTLYGAWLALLRRILHWWVRSTVLPEDFDDLALDRDRPVFYMIDTYALSSVLILEQVCMRLRLPRPLVPFQHGKASFSRSFGASRRYGGFILRRPKKRRHSWILGELIEAAADNGLAQVQIVPVTVLVGRAPDKEVSFFKILFSENWSVGGRLRRLFSTLINGRATMVQFGKPVTLERVFEETEDREQALRRVSRVLRVHFKRVRTAAIGPDRSHRRTLVERVVRSPAVQEAIAAKMRRDDMSRERAEAEARKYAHEIAADYSYTFVRIADLLLSWFWSRIYRGVTVHHFSEFREQAPGHEIVYVPCHRSHMDYMLLSWLLYHRGFVPPHIAAGVNLNMPLVGPLLRRGGAFFLRRTFRSQPLYAAVFNQYVTLILDRGVSLEYFIEGTRSRTGRLLPPRAGMLSITIRAFLRNPGKPVMFQPVYIGYERLAEGSSYISELSGRQKKPESLSDFRNVINILRKNYGEVAVSFGEPILLNRLLEAHHPEWSGEPLDENSKPRWLSGMVDDLARQIMVNINRSADVNPINLLATALLASRKQALDEDDLERTIGLLKDIIALTAYSDRITLTTLTPGQVIEYGLELGIIERQEHPLGNIIRTDATNAVLLTYFRNNIAHLVAMSAWIACCFLNVQRVRKGRVEQLSHFVYPFIRRELFLPWEPEELSGVIERCMQALIDMGLLRSSGEFLQRAAGGSDESYYLRLLGGSLLQTFERYFITVAVLVKNGSGRMTRKQLERLCILSAQRISLLHEFEAPEFYDRTLFRQFIESLFESGILGRDDDGHLTFDRQLEDFARDAKLVLAKEIRHTIIQVTPQLPELDQEAA